MRSPNPCAPSFSTSRATSGTSTLKLITSRLTTTIRVEGEGDRGRPRRVGQRPPEPLAEAEPAGGVGTAGRPGRQERGEDGDEAQAVQEEGRRHAESGDEQPGHGGPDDARPIEHERVEGDGIGEVGLADEIGDIGLTRGDVDRAAQPVDQREDGHVPVPDLPGPDEQGQRERLHHHRRLGQQDDPPLREAVAHGAADGRQDEDGGELQRGHQPELDRRSRQLEDEPRLAHALHPGPDQRDELSAPEEPEVSVSEGGQARRLRRSSGAPPPARAGCGRRRRASWPQSAGQAPRASSARAADARDNPALTRPRAGE